MFNFSFIHLYIKRLKIKKQTEKIGQEDRNDEENEKDNIKKLNRKIVSVHIAVEKQIEGLKSHGRFLFQILLFDGLFLGDKVGDSFQ